MLDELKANNRAWASGKLARDPSFFKRLVGQQAPKYLWIGCSDSRVPANEIVGLDPGEMFVHLNIANIITPGDANALAVVQYAIETLHVRHIIVCGHYGCGGVLAALEGGVSGAVERWLAPLRHIAYEHSAGLDAIGDRDARWRRLCEINVCQQVRRLQSTDVLSAAQARGIEVHVHSWIYDLRDGLLRDLAK